MAGIYQLGYTGKAVDGSTCCGGSGGGNPPTTDLPGCFCTAIPTRLPMTSAYPECNYRMYQNCNLVYGDPPPDVANAGFTARGFYSDQSFVDPITGESFWYYFWCRYNQFFLTRIFPRFPDGTPQGSPFRDAILYSWVVDGKKNNCSPGALALGCGTPFPGSDASCRVAINSAFLC